MTPITLSRALDFIRAGDYERRPDGLYLPGGKLGYVHHVTHLDRGGCVRSHESTHNLFPYEGINYLLNVGFHGQTPIATWYLFPFEGNYTPALTDTMATPRRSNAPPTTRRADRSTPKAPPTWA
jgi:hypothetical protein